MGALFGSIVLWLLCFGKIYKKKEPRSIRYIHRRTGEDERF